MKRLLFDLESNGFLDAMDTIHSLCIQDADTGEKWSCCDQPGHPSIAEGVQMLEQADLIIGHNIISFDVPAIQLLYPDFKPKAVYDTLVMAGLFHPNVEESDYKRKGMPGHLIGSQSLEAWGYRLNLLKGDFGKTTDWGAWTPSMQSYCELDVRVTGRLYDFLCKTKWSEVSMELEHRFAFMMQLQESNGFGFDEVAAAKLFATLAARRDRLTRSLQETFLPKVTLLKKPQYYTDPIHGDVYRIKGDCKKAAVRNRLIPGPRMEKHEEFNPGSRPEVAKRLKALGWKPDEFTESGLPKVDDETLARCDIPETEELRQYFVISKVIGMVGTGKNAWLKKVRDGKIHGRVIPYGTVTGRCSHANPNVAQTPSVTTRKDEDGNEHLVWGEEGGWSTDARALWGPTREGWVQVGADASGLELRCMGHFLFPYDAGVYAELAAGLRGDIHNSNRDTFGLTPDKGGRNKAKTGIYALIYGSGDENLGMSIGPLTPEFEKKAMAGTIPGWAVRSMKRRGPLTRERKINYLRGAYARSRVLEGIEGYSELVDAVSATVKRRGHLRGIDGRRLRVRKAHAALNALFQSAGALLVKQATVNMYGLLEAPGLKHGVDWAFMANIHDEVQAEARTVEIAHKVGQAFIDGLVMAGEKFGFKCPLDGEYKIGINWAETH